MLDNARLAHLVRTRSGLGGHALEESDIDRFVATVARLPQPPASVLDLGCGTGVLVDVLGELGYITLGIDTDETAMAAMAQPHLVGDIAALPVEDRAYDVVVLNEVIEHLPVEAYRRGIAEAARVARHRIIVTVPNAESLESASTRCRQCGCVFSIHGHVRRFDRDAMAGLFPGYELSSIGTVGPYKLRHRTVEWFLRRRLLGRWPAQPGSLCPQCGFRQPGAASARHGRSNPIGRLARWAYAMPWERWWLVAQYDRASPARTAADGEPAERAGGSGSLRGAVGAR